MVWLSPEWWWLAYLGLGLLVGFFAGMLGIGGGVILVPLLVFIFSHEHFAADRVLHLALGTSITSIVFTALSSVRAHHTRGAVRWDIVRQASPGIVIGTLLGTLFAERLSARYLAAIFTAFVLYSSVQLLLDRKPKPSRHLPDTAGIWLCAIAIGALCSLVGVAGGVILLPLLTMCNIPMIAAIGTTAALGLPISIAGSIGYIFTGWNESDLPPLSFGFLYLPALIGIVAGTFVTVPIGARVAHAIRIRSLKRIFAIVLLILAVKMLSSLL